MSEEKPVETNTDGAPNVTGPTGEEEDFRPVPAMNQMGPGELANVTPTREIPPLKVQYLIDLGYPDAEVVAIDWPEGHTTGAFVSAAASTRHEVEPYRWYQVSLSMFVAYGLFIGVPVLSGAWALFVIGQRVGWW
jgi:hypothetical protein